MTALTLPPTFAVRRSENQRMVAKLFDLEQKIYDFHNDKRETIRTLEGMRETLRVRCS